MSAQVVVSGGFDDLRPCQMRFLEEASKSGNVTVLLWPDETLRKATGREPRFPVAERRYVLEAIRYVSRVISPETLSDFNGLPDLKETGVQTWVDEEHASNQSRAAFSARHGLKYLVLPASQIKGFPLQPAKASAPGRKKIVVTGCYDWLHSGHVRFFEEVSGYGDLYVVVGHDANLRLLKGEGHPMFSQEERRYTVGSIRFVKEALISSGDGWLDADPEIRGLRPDIYVVNEDGDRGGKREYCEQLGIQYLVLKRRPAPGLAARRSTELRGF
jgi:cytidyltransferase-like protein